MSISSWLFPDTTTLFTMTACHWGFRWAHHWVEESQCLIRELPWNYPPTCLKSHVATTNSGRLEKVQTHKTNIQAKPNCCKKIHSPNSWKEIHTWIIIFSNHLIIHLKIQAPYAYKGIPKNLSCTMSMANLYKVSFSYTDKTCKVTGRLNMI